MRSSNPYIILFFLFFTVVIFAQENSSVDVSAIKAEELKKDLFEMASDEFKGRRAGTLDELRAAVWVAQKAREAGLQPAGEDGTFFQFFNLYRTEITSDSKVKLNGKELNIWKDLYISPPVKLQSQQIVTWLEDPINTSKEVTGKIVAFNLKAPSSMPAKDMSLWTYRYIASALREQTANLKDKNVMAILVVADSTAQSDLGFFGHTTQEGSYRIVNPDYNFENKQIPILFVNREFEKELRSGNAKLELDLNFKNYAYPSANVVAKAPGTDLQLKGEYVLFSGHHDHDGIGYPVNGDSIYNGADDNATVSVALLAIGRQWAKEPGKRSALFVWHGAEERGLLGSRYFVKHPLVDLKNIKAVLNGDMLGRNDVNEAALLGSIAPHKNSDELVKMAYNANDELTKFKIDTSWDEESHPENWYFRSDHLPYAQADVPAIFFTSLLHPEYHTPQDDAESIDIQKLLKMTQWMYLTGWKVSQTANPPALIAK